MSTPRVAKKAASAVTTPVSTIMSRDAITVRSGTSVEGVAELMLSRGLSRLPVVDSDGRMIGMISKTDLVQRAQDGDTDEESRAPLAGVQGMHVHGEPAAVDEIMTPAVTSIVQTESIQRAAELMAGAHIHGLPVVDGSGQLAGFVSSMDVLGWLAGLR
jgi:CBS domain-containing protein